MNDAWIPNLFLDQESSDIELHIETTADDCERVVPAHSLVLRFASEVFKTMLDKDNFKEGQTGIVKLQVKGNMEDAVFFLKYLYTRKLEQVDLSVYIFLLQTAHLYEVEDLVKLCNQRIAEVVTPLTVNRTYETLKNVASGNLLVHCKDLMLGFAFLIFRKDLHLFLDEETMSFLIASGKLNCLDEEQALGALWRWGCARQGLQNKPVKGINEQIGKFLPLLRSFLIKDVSDRSPWFALWEDFKSRTDACDSSMSTKTDSAVRQPDEKIKINAFSEVAYLNKFTDNSSHIPRFMYSKNYCLMEFSVNRDILLSGISLQVVLGEKLNPQYSFQIYVNHAKVSQLKQFDKFFVTEYSKQRINLTPVVPNKFCFPSTTVDDHFYIYDLLIHFRTPVLLRKTEVNLLTMDVTPDPPVNFYLTVYGFPKGTTFDFQRNLQFRARGETVAVNQIRYFV